MRDKSAIEAGLARRFGMDEETRKNVGEFNAAQTDWKAVCHICMAHLTGTLEQIKAHRCDSTGQ